MEFLPCPVHVNSLLCLHVYVMCSGEDHTVNGKAEKQCCISCYSLTRSVQRCPMRQGYVLRRKGFTISTSRESPSPPPSAVVDPENSVLIKVSLQTVLPHLAQILRIPDPGLRLELGREQAWEAGSWATAKSITTLSRRSRNGHRETTLHVRWYRQFQDPQLERGRFAAYLASLPLALHYRLASL